MKKYRNSIFYIATIGGFSVLIYWIIVWGSRLQQGHNMKAVPGDQDSWAAFVASLAHNIQHPLALLLAQIITIILVARLFSWICRKIGQPGVVGEMIAGILLGPSLLGMYFPELSQALFPVKSLANLQFLSQIGLILFMFIVGMELDLKVLKNKAHDAVVISHASIIIPFALGVGLAYFVYAAFAPEGTQFISFALFIGIAMSITAFPVLARIIQERDMYKTRLGTIAITCAAADDITAWCLLAAVIAIVKAGSFVSAIYVMILAVLYVFLMIRIVRPFLKRVSELHNSRGNLSKPVVAIFFLVLIISAFVTETIGIHALFGAFMAGAIMPENTKFRNIFIEKVEDVALVLLLPLFFVFTGLRTEIGLLNDPHLWLITGLIILVAVVGKFAGSAIAAKYVGQSWKDSLTIGALMNTRGLMELVVLNVGYDLGVLSPGIFAMMVIMALVTTFMTGPSIDLINWIYKKKEKPVPEEMMEANRYKILLSFDSPGAGKSMMRLANSLTRKFEEHTTLTAMHLAPVNELHHYDIEEYEKEVFAPLEEASGQLNRKITTLFKASGDMESDMMHVVNKGDFDLVLIEIGRSIYEGSLLGKVLGFTTRMINPEKLINTVTGKDSMFDNYPLDERSRHLLAKSQVPTGAFIDKNLEQIEKVFIPMFDAADGFLLQYIQKMINNAGVQITIMDLSGQIRDNAAIKEQIRAIEQIAPNHITFQSRGAVSQSLLSGQDLMLISFNTWKALIDKKQDWLQDIPSTLVITGF